MEPAEDSIDEMPTAKDAAAAGISLCAFMLNFSGALPRYYSWLVEQGVLDANALPTEQEYRAHLEVTMAHFMATYELFELNSPAGRTDPGLPQDARMSSEVAVRGPAHAFQRPREGGGRHRLRYVA